jgi:hypothetical protein
MKLTPNQSHYVLGSLLSQRKVRAAQVQKVLKGRGQEIKSLRERLASLEGLGKLGLARGGARRRRRGRKPRRRAMSSRVRALRRLQGKYMGYVRNLKAAEKARVRSVREKQGMGAAIKLASSLSSKR